MHLFYMIFIFISLINYIYSFVHITLYILCDDICSNIYIDETLLDLNELEYDNTKHYRFQKINFYANPGQKLTIITQNHMGAFGIAAKIIIHSNDYYIYDTKSNIGMFSSNITDEINEIPIIDCNIQTYADICNELEFVLGSNNNSYVNQLIEFYFTIPNELNHETLYINDNIEEIMVGSNDTRITLNVILHLLFLMVKKIILEFIILNIMILISKENFMIIQMK